MIKNSCAAVYSLSTVMPYSVLYASGRFRQLSGNALLRRPSSFLSHFINDWCHKMLWFQVCQLSFCQFAYFVSKKMSNLFLYVLVITGHDDCSFIYHFLLLFLSPVFAIFHNLYLSIWIIKLLEWTFIMFMCLFVHLPNFMSFFIREVPYNVVV